MRRGLARTLSAGWHRSHDFKRGKREGTGEVVLRNARPVGKSALPTAAAATARAATGSGVR